MSRQYLRPNSPIDILTADELKEAMGHSVDNTIRGLLRGVDYLTFQGNNNANTIALPGPESGYCWSLKMASVQLSGAGQFCVYLSENTGTPPIASIASDPANQAIATWSANQVVIKDSRVILFSCTAATINTWMLRVKQVPTEMQGKL